MPVGELSLGEIVVYDQGIHAVFHEPLAERSAGEGREVLVGGVVGGGSGDDDRVLQRVGGLEGGEGAADAANRLANGATQLGTGLRTAREAQLAKAAARG